MSCKSDILGYLSEGDVWGEVKDWASRALEALSPYCPRLARSFVEAACIVAASLLAASMRGDGWVSLLAYKVREAGLGGALAAYAAGLRSDGLDSLYLLSGAVRLAVQNHGCGRAGGYRANAAVIVLAADIVYQYSDGTLGVLAAGLQLPERLRDRERPLSWLDGYAGIPRLRNGGRLVWVPNGEVRRQLARGESYGLLLAGELLPSQGIVERLVAAVSHLVQLAKLHGQPYRLDEWEEPRASPCTVRRGCLRIVRLDEIVMEPVGPATRVLHG